MRFLKKFPFLILEIISWIFELFSFVLIIFGFSLSLGFGKEILLIKK
ncbi:TPA: hypothetical protein HA335_05785 [Methanocaldococcus jannaschii]|uniref:Uncharacterized protein n=1 Tax=Methanocaldococcus jannaschii TaxID=2190 RepID=A0A832T4I8_9EURY|nr:hypothetical protein [Methanocaldococcus jannaschii]